MGRGRVLGASPAIAAFAAVLAIALAGCGGGGSSCGGRMDEKTFWCMIDQSRAKADGDLEQQADLLDDDLSSRPPADIVEFDRLWSEKRVAAYRWDLWAAAYVIQGGCSDDCFTDLCNYLVSLGESTYRAALDDPNSRADVPGIDPEDDWEAVSYVAPTAYERAGQDEMPDVGPFDPDDPAGEEWDEADAGSVVPRLAAKFG